MIRTIWRQQVLLWLCLVAVWMSAAWSRASDGKSNPSPPPAGEDSGGGTPVPFPGLKIPQMPNQNLTPEQWQMMMQMRMLQSRGSGRGIRTGYPQFIPFGMPFGQANWAGNQPAGGANAAAGGTNQTAGQDANAEQAGAPRKSTKERRAEARKAAEQKKRAAREARDAKMKARAAKAKEAKAAAKGQPNDKEKQN
jgi:hypothetical protein